MENDGFVLSEASTDNVNSKHKENEKKNPISEHKTVQKFKETAESTRRDSIQDSDISREKKSDSFESIEVNVVVKENDFKETAESTRRDSIQNSDISKEKKSDSFETIELNIFKENGNVTEPDDYKKSKEELVDNKVNKTIPLDKEDANLINAESHSTTKDSNNGCSTVPVPVIITEEDKVVTENNDNSEIVINVVEDAINIPNSIILLDPEAEEGGSSSIQGRIVITDEEDDMDQPIAETEEYSEEVRIATVSMEDNYLLMEKDDFYYPECYICLISEEELQYAICEDCSNIICFSCLKLHIANTISNYGIVIKCPGAQSCSKVFSDQLISAFTIPKLLSILIKNRIESDKNPYVKTCPGCHKVENVQEKSNIICTNCDMSWCFYCHSPWHKGLTCDEYQKDVEKSEGKRALKYWAKSKIRGINNARKCPKCQHYIEKSSGCDHMTCNKCETEFCYRCGKKYYSLWKFGDHSSKYSFIGCKYNFQPHRPYIRIPVRFIVTLGIIILFPIIIVLFITSSPIVIPCLIYRCCKNL